MNPVFLTLDEVVITLVLVLVVLVGLRQVARWRRGAKAFTLALAASGVFAFVVHLSFIAAENPEFRTPVSLVVLAGAFVTSVAQPVVVVRCPSPRRATPH